MQKIRHWDLFLPEKEQFSEEMKSLFIYDEYNKSDKSVVLENFVSLLNITLFLVNYLSYIQTSNVKLEKLLTQKIT